MEKGINSKLKLNLQFFATGQTKLAQMIDPEVMARMISAGLPNAIRFAPLAEVDNTLAGQPGSTITIPKFAYIGDATAVAEGAAIDLSQMQTTTDQATIKKFAKGGELTDEAVLSGYGDPVGELQKQLTMSIGSGVDNDVLTEVAKATVGYEMPNGDTLNVSHLDSAQQKFGDEQIENMVLIAHPKDAAKLRADAANQWARASDLGDTILKTGVFGEILGAEVVRSSKLTEGTAYLVKSGAIKIYLKRDVAVESDRDIVNKTSVITADEHFTAHLYDDAKVVKITTAAV